MGCCGCDNKTSAVTAGIFGLVQSAVGLILNAYFINMFTTYSYPLDLNILDARMFLVFATWNAHTCVVGLLVTAAVLHGVWFLSSITLLIGNANDNACCVRQWVVWTSFVIIGDIVLPVIFIISTVSSFVNVVNSVIEKIDNPGTEGQLDKTWVHVVNWASSTVALDLLKYYIILLMSFLKLGLITLITNICLNVFTDRRASDICNPRGHVVCPSVTIIQGQPDFPEGMIQIGPGFSFPRTAFVYNNPGFPPNGTTFSSGSPNTPMHPIMAFSTPQAANAEPESVCNNVSTESLIQTKLNNDLHRNSQIRDA